jgi:cation:H+ antiporter
MHRNPNKMFSRAGAQHALSAAISINMTVLACIAIFLGPQLAGLNVGEIGLGPIFIGVTYALALRLIYYDQRPGSVSVASRRGSGNRLALAKALSVYAASALVIFIAAPFMAESAGEIADITGLGRTFVGSSLVAFCTSLPEVVSTITAVRMGAFDLAVGNIFGSNAFNMILLIPLDLIQEGNLLGRVSRAHILTGLAVILATSVAVMGQLYQSERRTKFFEPDAFTVIGIVFGAMLVLYWLGMA